MIPIKENIYEIEEVRYPVLDTTTSKFAIGYWYGVTYHSHKQFILNPDIQLFIEFVKNYDAFLRCLFACGVKMDIIASYVEDYLTTSLDFIKKEDISMVETNVLENIILDMMLLYYSFELPKLDDTINEFQKGLLSGHQFNNLDNELWVHVMQGGNGITKTAKPVDELLVHLISNNLPAYVKVLEEYIDHSKTRGLRGFTSNKNSKNLLAKITGFYNYAFSLLREGYLKVFQQYNNGEDGSN